MYAIAAEGRMGKGLYIILLPEVTGRGYFSIEGVLVHK